MPTSTIVPTPGTRSTCGRIAFLAPDAPLIQCSSHGALFEMETGLCLAGPCPGARLRPIELRIDQGYVLVADDVQLSEPADLAR